MQVEQERVLRSISHVCPEHGRGRGKVAVGGFVIPKFRQVV